MKLVYVAGRFRGPDSWAVHRNVQAALAVGFEVARIGGVPVIPHSMYQAFDRTLTDDYWLAATLEHLRRCDAVMLVPGWTESRGAMAEQEEAARLGMPTFSAGAYDVLHAWLRGEWEWPAPTQTDGADKPARGASKP